MSLETPEKGSDPSEEAVSRSQGEAGPRIDARVARPPYARDETSRKAGCGKSCAVENGKSNPCLRQGKPGEMLSGQPSYPTAKASWGPEHDGKAGTGRTCQTRRPARPARYGQGWIA